jgi:hypothetical protein
MNDKNSETKQSFSEKIADVTGSKIFKRFLIALLVVFVLVLVFGAGTMVGFKKANFSYQWGENYHKNFGGPREGFMPQMMRPLPTLMGGDFMDAHGTAGEILQIDGNNLIVKGDDNTEKTIIVNDKTAIRQGQQDLKASDLKVGGLIVTIGNPNNSGQIEAKLIRVFGNQ